MTRPPYSDDWFHPERQRWWNRPADHPELDGRNPWPATDRVDPDDAVAHLVAGGLMGDSDVRAGRLDVLVQNRVVIVRGYVPSEDVRLAVLRRVWATPGVFDVCDLLVVEEKLS
jgi:osmotically-inducible protein OsmY